MSENSDLLGWFKGGCSLNKAAKYKKILTLSALIIVMSCFFYVQKSYFKTKSYKSDFDNSFFLPHFRKNKALSEIKSGINNSKEINVSIKKIESIESKDKSFESELYALVGNAPIKEMIPYIAQKKDRRVAGLIIGIAKKESDWGKHSPSKNGKTCYNFWGYKGAGSRGKAMGYGCFASAEEGIEIISKRIQKLVGDKLDNPARMIVWKCGSSCVGHNPTGVQKWINDVSLYYDKIIKIAG